MFVKSQVAPSRDDWDAHWTSFSDAIGQNPAQAFRHRSVTAVAKKCAPRRVVDIGSGQGDLLSRIAREMPSVELFGIEMSAVGVAETNVKVPRATVLQADLLDADAGSRLEPIAADLAFCIEVIEHLDDPLAFLRVAKRALAPGGTLVVTVPGGPRSAFDRLIGHRRHYSADDLGELLRTAGFEVQRAATIGFPFFNLYRLIVIARGDRLASDITSGSTWLARNTMRVFSALMRFSIRTPRLGWQTIGIARTPTSSKPDPGANGLWTTSGQRTGEASVNSINRSSSSRQPGSDSQL